MITYVPELQTRLEALEFFDIYHFMNSIMKKNEGFIMLDAKASIKPNTDLVRSFADHHDTVTRFMYYDQLKRPGRWATMLDIYVALPSDRVIALVDKFDKLVPLT